MTLRPYQIEDVLFLSKLDCAACFNEQRTGKTPTIINVLIQKRLRKALIICPASALYQWQEEHMRWTQRPCVVIAGTPKQKQEAIKNWTYGAVISYNSFKMIKRKNKTTGEYYYTGLVHDILQANPDVIIVDEAHRMKNPKSAIAKAIFETIKIPYRYALTGTPATKRAYDLYCILHWLYPALFKSYWGFIREYFEVERKINYGTGKPYFEIGNFLPGKAEVLQRYLKQFSTQRKRAEVMPWLPQKDYQRVRLPASKEQQKYLRDLEQYFETEHIIVQGILDRLIRYRQICLHPGLLGLSGGSPKSDWVRDYLEDYPEEPVIIFSKFTSYLKLLDQEIKKKKGVIIGETPIKIRQQLKEDFQNGKINLLLINVDAGKESLTLDRAETIIFTDIYPPASDVQQAEDRFIATTKDRATKPHKIIQLMIRDSYDERLYDLVQEYAEEIDVVNDYKKYLNERR